VVYILVTYLMRDAHHVNSTRDIRLVRLVSVPAEIADAPTTIHPRIDSLCDAAAACSLMERGQP
jgi:hypothetical protein